MKIRTVNGCVLAMVASIILLASPDAIASTGGGGLSGLVDDLKEILNTWFAQAVVLFALAVAAYRLVAKFDLATAGSAIMVALILKYGPDFLISLTGAVI